VDTRSRKTASLAPALLVLAVVFAYAPVGSGQTASSPSFQLSHQILNGGGGLSASATFSLVGCFSPDPVAAGSSSSTSFRLDTGCVQAAVGLCGNGTLDPGETCDDGNGVNGDGCSSGCALENGWTCQGEPSVCIETCGDGLVVGGEQCDDGNMTDGDGCSAACTVEPGWICPGQPFMCTRLCGNGILDVGEGCDDGNTGDGDGCSASCADENGWICNGEPSICEENCGDGLVVGEEQCDDGNLTPGDGCDQSCERERFRCCAAATTRCNADDACPIGDRCCSGRCCDVPATACAEDAACGAAQCCAPRCGDGYVDPGEQCDLDGQNGQPGSGCTSDCRLEGRCTGSGAGTCRTAADCPPGEGCCGNGVPEGGEECDDGNLADGDCCSSTCQAETAPACLPLPAICAGVIGPHVITNPTVRRTALRDGTRPTDGVLDRWATRGEFSLHDGQSIDPDTEIVEYVLSQDRRRCSATTSQTCNADSDCPATETCVDLYHAVLDPVQCLAGVCFTPRFDRLGIDQSWTFRLLRGQPDIPGGPGWQRGKFTRDRYVANKVKFSLAGKNAAIGTPEALGGVRRVRQTIKIGDDCITRALDCAPNGRKTAFTCLEVHCGNGIIERGERCGEPGLPACISGNVCDTCRCVTQP
jgi:cysteine-rich repeat protein